MNSHRGHGLVAQALSFAAARIPLVMTEVRPWGPKPLTERKDQRHAVQNCSDNETGTRPQSTQLSRTAIMESSKARSWICVARPSKNLKCDRPPRAVQAAYICASLLSLRSYSHLIPISSSPPSPPRTVQAASIRASKTAMEFYNVRVLGTGTGVLVGATLTSRIADPT